MSLAAAIVQQRFRYVRYVRFIFLCVLLCSLFFLRSHYVRSLIDVPVTVPVAVVVDEEENAEVYDIIFDTISRFLATLFLFFLSNV